MNFVLDGLDHSWVMSLNAVLVIGCLGRLYPRAYAALVVGMVDFAVKGPFRLICVQYFVGSDHFKVCWVLEHETESAIAGVCDDDFPRLSHVVLVDR